MVKVELICKICGKTYYKPPSQAKNSKYCSKECKNKSQITRITFTCLNCGKQSTEVPSRISKGLGRFCSQKCFHEYKKLHPKPSGEYINCKYCGELFYVRPSLHKRKGRGQYCSKKCYDLAQTNRIKTKCLTCNKEFEIKPSDLKLNRGKYCSNKCRYIGRTKKITKQCEYCGKSFETRPLAIKQGSGKYCSNKCKDTANRRKIILTCEYCGKEYENIKSRENKSRFCSRKCQNKYLIGENASGWKGGISFEPYCPKFNEEFKERVREFWNRRCGICGKPESKNDQKLSVHHISYNKNDCCHEGEPVFIPTCKSCHIRTNKNRSFWKEILSNYIMIWFNGESYLQKFN